MSCKSAIYTVNTSLPTVAAAGVISPGTTIRRFGCNITQSGDGILISGPGYYEVNLSATVSPTAAGTVMVSLFQDGAVISGGTAAETVAGAGDTANLSVGAVIRLQCCDTSTTITVVLSGVTSAVVNNLSIVVKKL